MLTCTLLKAHDLTARDLTAWRAMAAATEAFASPLLSPEFTRAVAEVRDDVHVAVYRRGAEIVGFLPHHRRPGRFARPAGAPFSDYSALITFPEPELHIREAL
ncbi:MAG: GNAT family N-acetyltransferase, partial [Asticcacaulis sp.]|nr:GNAT family N-acetyltransferase [Asticcacaulis sp.]